MNAPHVLYPGVAYAPHATYATNGALLAKLGELLDLAGGAPVNLSLTVGTLHATLKVEDLGPAPEQPLPVSASILDALQLSEDEAKIVGAIRKAGRPLLGKNVAAAIGWKYDTRLKLYLANLEARGVLLHADNRGYTLPDLTDEGD